MPHTPGSWEQSKAERCLVRAGKTLVADTIPNHLTHRCEHQPTAEEALANARLIAAAPELLACLEDTASALLAAFGQVDDPDNPEGWSDRDAYQSYKKAQAVIRKAKGA